MSEWKEYKLGEVVAFQRGNELPRTQSLEKGQTLSDQFNTLVGEGGNSETVSRNFQTPSEKLHFYLKEFEDSSILPQFGAEFTPQYVA